MENNKKSIYISLTTIPNRIKNIDITLNSLLNQSYLPDKLIINIPHKYDRYDEDIIIPEFLYKEKRFCVNRCEDFGPATKILGLISDNLEIKMDDIIIVCDDDREYDINFIKNLVEGLKNNPNCCVTNAGWEIEQLSLFRYTKTKFPRGIEYKRSGYIDVLGGCCGFALYYKFIYGNKELLQIYKKSLLFYVDDIWISGHLTVKGINIWILDTGIDSNVSINNNIDALSNNSVFPRSECNNFAIDYFIKKYNIWYDKHDNKLSKHIYDTKNIFTNIYDLNFWGDGSGPGSKYEYNIEYIEILQKLFNDFKICDVIDIGCGDWQFSQYIDFKNINYLGIDIVENVIRDNNIKYKKNNINFRCLDIIEYSKKIKNTDLIILKDVLQHWPTQVIIETLNDLLLKTKYILVTNCCNQQNTNREIYMGEWCGLTCDMYPLNLFNPTLIKKYKTKEINLIKGNLLNSDVYKN